MREESGSSESAQRDLEQTDSVSWGFFLSRLCSALLCGMGGCWKESWSRDGQRVSQVDMVTDLHLPSVAIGNELQHQFKFAFPHLA